MVAPPPEAPEPYADYEVDAPAAPALHLLLVARVTPEGVCLTWEGVGDGVGGTALGTLDEAGRVLLHALAALLGHPQAALPSGDTAPSLRAPAP